MSGRSNDLEVGELHRTSLERAAALFALQKEPGSKDVVAEALDVAPITAHRVLNSLIDLGLVERSNGEYVLTGFGRSVEREVGRFCRTVAASERLAPLLDVVEDDGRIDVLALEDARVTVATPEDPHAPTRRFAELIEGTETFLAVVDALPPPHVVNETSRVMAEADDVEVIFAADVLESDLSALVEAAPPELMEKWSTARVVDHAPFSLTIFDERIATSAVDPRTGMAVGVDSDDEAARKWAEREWERYHSLSRPFGEDVP